ncbi:hypothetical protein JXA32_09505 [Candidatus Sumerlaeota bacterium]|nr:hypothetical protein [Candidatus Sumerlaeota bacterium]
MSKRSLFFIAAVLLMFTKLGLCDEDDDYRTDSRSPYVHLINIYDADGEKIAPQEREFGEPYSPAATCSKCHDVDDVNEGWHFNAGETDIAPGRQGEPWIWTDPATRTALPLSYREWPGTYRPSALGLTDWQFALRFGRHLPGGPIFQQKQNTAADSGAQKALDEFEEFDVPADILALGGHDVDDHGAAKERWKISGALENDCLICHSGNMRYSADLRASMIAHQNFKWAPVAASGLASVMGYAENLPDNYDPDDFTSAAQLPRTKYRRYLFDDQGQAYFDIVRAPKDERCYFCHSTHGADPSLPPRFQRDKDVHLRAGMHCVDCHRHGLDHAMSRGYEGETGAGSLRVTAGTLTCRACHIEQEGETQPATAGRLGAPLADHEDLPIVHLEELECTVCHSGNWPGDRTYRVQTAMAHALGLAQEHRSPSDPPYITEPVFVRQENGKIGVHRMIWPSFWGAMVGDAIAPLGIEQVNKALEDALKAPQETEEDEEALKGWEPLGSEEIATALQALQASFDDSVTSKAVFVSGGVAHHLNHAGSVDTFEHPAAASYSWPLAHDVRGEGQSMGALECTDCHADNSPFFFGKVAVDGTTTASPAPSSRQIDMQGEYELEYVRVGLAFKWLIIVTMTLLILHILADLIQQLVRRSKT